MIWLLHTSTWARSLLPWFYTLLLFLIHEMSDPCIRVHLICIQWREELLCFIQYFCVCAFFFFFFLGLQFYVNEVCHVARFGISAWNSFHDFIFPYPSTPIFYDSSTFPLVGCSPWGLKESGTTERLHFHFSLSCTGPEYGDLFCQWTSKEAFQRRAELQKSHRVAAEVNIAQFKVS